MCHTQPHADMPIYQFTYAEGMQGSVDLRGCLCTEMASKYSVVTGPGIEQLG